MSRIIKNTLLNYLATDFKTENTLNDERISEINTQPVRSGCIIYVCEREIRAKDNFALQFGLKKSEDLKLPIKIIHPRKAYKYNPKQEFLDNQIRQTQRVFQRLNIDFEISNKSASDIIKDENPAMLLIDFNPILKRNYLKGTKCKVYEIDSHNIIPARFISNKQEYSAATLRTKIYHSIYHFLTEYKKLTEEKTEADYVLRDFIKNKLQHYEELRNNPTENVLSGLSKYLNSGFISSQRVALEVIKSNVSDNNKEAFLEELIVRKELADNFCLYGKGFKNFSSIPNWAKTSLKIHKNDIREYEYLLPELENGNTHDRLWNATQTQLKKEGTIHGYLRMYWAKKILEWSNSPKDALKRAIYLNDKYAYDSPSANGYSGILWAIGGLHDRAFKDYLVTGKIRRMTYTSIKRKFDLDRYIKKYQD